MKELAIIGIFFVAYLLVWRMSTKPTLTKNLPAARASPTIPQPVFVAVAKPNYLIGGLNGLGHWGSGWGHRFGGLNWPPDSNL